MTGRGFRRAMPHAMNAMWMTTRFTLRTKAGSL